MFSALAATAIFSASAQMNLPVDAGFHNRAISMYQDKNYQGCIDQMSQLLETNPTLQQQEEAEYYIAMSSMYKGDADALTKLNTFLENYPTSIHRMDVKMAVGDCYFNAEDYASALAQYKMVEPGALEYTREQDYVYRKAYCHLRLADYLEAENGFRSLMTSSQYGNSAKFYVGYIAYVNKDYASAVKLFDQVDANSELGEMSNYYKAQVYFLNKDYKKALSTSRKLLKNDVDPLYIAEANRIAGESLYNMGDIVSAIPYLQAYVDEVENPLPSSLYILGVSHYKNHEYTKAIETLEGVVGENNAMGQGAYLMIGQSLLKKKDSQAAMLALNKAVKMDYDLEMQELAFYNYAVASSQGGTIPFGNSVANFEEFLRRYPNSPFVTKVEEYIVTGYMADNNYEQALESINKIKTPSANILKAKQKVLYTLGVHDFANGNTSQAIAYLNKSKSYSKCDEELAREVDLWLGNCYYQQEEYDDAVDYYLAYIDACDGEEDNLPLAYYNLGYAYYKQENQYADAITNFECVLDEPGNLSDKIVADAYCRIGDCHYLDGNYALAAENYDKAYNGHKSTGDYALYQKAMMQGYNRDITSKIKTLDEVLDQYPTSGIVPSALLEKAQSYIDKGKNNQAIETYKQLVKEHPSTTQGRNGYLQLAIAYLNNGNKAEAINTYKNVITNYVTSNEARLASQDLMRLYAADNNLETYTAFMSTVSGAMLVEESDIEEAAYEAAESAYLDDNEVGQLYSYLEKYPNAGHRVSVLGMLVDYEYENSNEEQALVYAEEIITQFPDNAAVEPALSVKAEIEYNQGKLEKALEDYQKLEKYASSTRVLNEARMGVLRSAYDLEQYNIVIEKTDELLASQMDEDLITEVKYYKSVALSNTGKMQEAIELWGSLSEYVEDLYGATSAIELSQYYYEIGELENARIEVEKFINSGTPHQYWLARGYIVLSDINRKEGKTFEANEYLRILRENYPGSDADIFKMIDERLK